MEGARLRFRALYVVFAIVASVLILLSSGGEAMAVANAAGAMSNKANLPGSSPARKKPLDYLGISAHVAAAVGATVELTEDFEQLHHGHGMLLLVVSKIIREINLLRESIDEAVEDAHGKSFVRRFAAGLWTIMTSKQLAMVLAITALYAASAEVIEDVAPGGHHGAALLAINELSELLVQARIVRGGFFLRILENRVFKVTLLGAALIAAFCEVFSSGQIHFKGHHGVAILACMKVIRCLGLSRDALKKSGEKED